MDDRSVTRKIRMQQVKNIVLGILFLLFLPYMITIFLQGMNGKLEQKSEVYWEPYFIGILALECPKECELECLKAQAVLIRTRLYQQMEEEQELKYTEPYLNADEMADKWRGLNYDKQYEKFVKAMKETEGEVLFYEGAYAWTPYHKSSNGMTRNAEEVVVGGNYPYLTAKECPKDEDADEEHQTMIYEYEEVQSCCRPFLLAVSQEASDIKYHYEDFEILSHDTSNYVKELKIGDTICTGDQFRDALNLASSSFSLRDVNGKLKITTTGCGHGLGMSQWTANEMAKEGMKYKEILNFFFEGTELKRA